MVKRIGAIVVIYVCTVLAWVILGATIELRTGTQDQNLKTAVNQLWGTPQRQRAPQVYYQTHQQTKVETVSGGKVVKELKTETTNHPLLLDGSDIDVTLNLEHRQKGLFWYSTYRVGFTAKYRVVNYTNEPREIFFDFAFPTTDGVYDNFRFVLGELEEPNLQVVDGKLGGSVKLQKNESKIVEVAYQSQGLDEWWYDFGENVNQAKNFSLTMDTNFDQIDFPPSSISPTRKEPAASGWRLSWQYASLLSGVKIGMATPHKLNPGPWVQRVTYSAPVSLFLFFFVFFILTTIKNVKVHPMNYFFVGAAYFSFHLLLAYLVDHVSIHLAFFICSLVSITLVVSYMRLVVGARFALVEVGLMQFVYLVLFSYTYFFEAFTGLAITILCITTLFVVMQFTGRIDWDALFRKQEGLPTS